MSKLRLVLLITFVGMCLALAGQVNRLTISQISLERTMCYGTCPAYKITIMSDGTTWYRGDDYVERKGLWKGTGALAFQNLVTYLQEINYLKLKDKYRGPFPDAPSETITITCSDGKTKTIRTFGVEIPNQVWAVQTLIDGTAANVRDWKLVK